MQQDLIQDLREFDRKIFDLVQDYVYNQEIYQDYSVLAINPKSYEVPINNPSVSQKIESYELSKFISKDDNRNLEPDCDVTNVLASKYYFIW